MTDSKSIKNLPKKDLMVLKTLYEKHAGTMLAVCKRYCTDEAQAKDIMHDGFLKVYDNMEQLTNRGSLEGWIRRIMINQAMDYHRKRNKESSVIQAVLHENDEYVHRSEHDDPGTTRNRIGNSEALLKMGITTEEISCCLKQIPQMYRVVFELFVLKGYDHKRISALLRIDERLSRTRLSRSREMIKARLCTYAREELVTA